MKWAYTKDIERLKSLKKGEIFSDSKEEFEVQSEYEYSESKLRYRAIVKSKKTNIIYHIFDTTFMGGKKVFFKK